MSCTLLILQQICLLDSTIHTIFSYSWSNNQLIETAQQAKSDKTNSRKSLSFCKEPKYSMIKQAITNRIPEDFTFKYNSSVVKPSLIHNGLSKAMCFVFCAISSAGNCFDRFWSIWKIHKNNVFLTFSKNEHPWTFTKPIY